MKSKLPILAAFLVISFPAFSQKYIKMEEKHIYKDLQTNEGKPQFDYVNYKVEDYDKIKIIFKFLKDSSQIQFNYPQGNCHNRAELMCMFLKKKNISNFKIWNFAPSQFSLICSKMLEVKDKNDFTPGGIVKWGYHVAPTVLTRISGKLDTLVLDPSLFNEPISYKKWLSVQGCKESFYTFLNPEWYLFFSMNGIWVSDYEDYDKNCKTDDNVLLPNYLPRIMTGDFYQYKGFRFDQKWVEKGMAINDMAYKFYLNEIIPIKNNAEKSELIKEYKTLFGSVNNLESIMLGYASICKIDAALLDKHKELIEKYRQIFNEETTKWIDKTKGLY
jgi:hypothetical protein